VPSDGRKKNLLDLIRTYKNKENSTKTGGDGTTTKTTTYAKKTYANLSQKKRKYSFFHLTIRKNSNNYKKNTIHHHIKKSHTYFKMISNHQRTVLKLFMKKEKCMRKSTTKKTLTKSHQFI